MSFDVFALLQLAPSLSLLEKMIRRADVEGGALVVYEIQVQYPQFSALVETMFAGTPQDTVESLAAFWPAVESVPDILSIVGRLQVELRNIWEKKRANMPGE